MRFRRFLVLLASVLVLAGISVGAVLAASPAQVENQNADAAQTTPYLGANVSALEDGHRKRLDLPEDLEGLLVVKVDEDGPAAAAGVQLHSVITKANGEEVDEPSDLRKIVSPLEPGTVVTLTVYQEGATHEMAVTLGEKPVREDRPARPKFFRFPGLGGFLRGHPNVIDGQLRTMDEDGAVHVHKVTVGTVTAVSENTVTLQTVNGETPKFVIGNDVPIIKGGDRAEIGDVAVGDKAAVTEMDGQVTALVVGPLPQRDRDDDAKERAEKAKERAKELHERQKERAKELRERAKERRDEQREDQKENRGDLQQRLERIQNALRQMNERIERLEAHHQNQG